jgi:hypothetical protein
MHRLSPFAFAAALALLAACAERPADPVGPASANVTAGMCPSAADIRAQIAALFPRASGRAPAEARFSNIQKLLSRGTASDSLTAQRHTRSLIEFTLKKYADGQTSGGPVALTAFLNSLLCFAGLPSIFDPSNFGDDGAVAVILPNSPPTDVVTGNEWAGVHINTGSVTEPTIVTIRRLPDFPGPLFTSFDQYPLYYEFDASVLPPTGFEQPVLVGVCLPADLVLDPGTIARLRLAHNVPPYDPETESIEVLPLADPTFLDCSDAGLAAATRGGFLDLASRGGRLLGAGLLALIGPPPLYAASFLATGGVGGTTRNFSPFGAVDTLGILLVSDPQPISGLSVAETPAVAAMPTQYMVTAQLRTFTGEPMPGFRVLFEVISGGGTIVNGDLVTGPDGSATAGPWTTGASGAGPNLLRVTAFAPPGRGFDKNPSTVFAP